MITETFTVPGLPIGKGRPRVTRYGTYTPQKTLDYEKKVRTCWEKECSHSASEGVPVYVSISAYFPIPKSTSKKKAKEMDGTHHIKRPDADNVTKAILDALNGLAFPDDSAVQLRQVYKYQITGEPHTDVILEWEEQHDD